MLTNLPRDQYSNAFEAVTSADKSLDIWGMKYEYPYALRSANSRRNENDSFQMNKLDTSGDTKS
jgi:hypothetical protein